MENKVQIIIEAFDKTRQVFDALEGTLRALNQDIVSAEKSKNATISALNTQQVRHSKGIVDQIKNHWVAASIAVAAAWMGVKKAIDKLSDTAMAGARYETLGVVMAVVGKNAGYTASEMDKYAAALQRAGISMTESRQSLTRMVQANLDLAQSTQLARIAQDAAVIGNINSSEAFQRLVYGIQSAQIEMLRTIGINVNFETSYAKVAKATGRTAASFSETEKAAIRTNAVIEKGRDIAGTYEAAMGTAGKKIGSFARYLEDFKVKMGTAFNPATTSLVDAATEAMKHFQEEISKPESQAALKNMSVELSKIIISVGKDLPSALNKLLQQLKLMTSFLTGLPEGVAGAAGAGIVGRLLFGSTPAGVALASLYYINTALDKMANMGIGSIPKKISEGGEAMQNIMDVLAGRKDWQTGKNINPFMQGGAAGKKSGAGRSWEDPEQAAAAERERKRKEEADKAAAATRAEAAREAMAKLSESWKPTLRGLELDIKNAPLEDAFDKKLNDVAAKAAELREKFGQVQGAEGAISLWEAAMGDEAAHDAAMKDFDEYLKKLGDLRRVEKEGADERKKAAQDAQALAEADISRQLAQIDLAEKMGDLSAEESIRRQIDLTGQLLAAREAALAAIDRGTDPTGWITQQNAIDATRAKLGELTVANREYAGTFADGWRHALKDYTQSADKEFARGRTLAEATAKGMEQAFSDFFFDAMTGKLRSFGDYIQSFLSSVARAMANVMAQNASSAVMQFNWSSLIGGGSAPGYAIAPTGATGYGGAAGGYHRGGMADEPTFYRIVPRHAFLDAPRYHGGIGPGEKAAIIRNDEGVFTPGQMKALGLAAQNTAPTQVKVEVINQASGEKLQATNARASFNAQELVVTVWLDAFSRNAYGLRSALGG